MNEKLKAFQNRKRRSETMVILGGALLIISTMLFVFDIAFFFLVFALFIAGAVTLFLGYSSYSSIQGEFKNQVLKNILEESVEDGEYNPRMGLSANQIYQGECLDKADDVRTEDFLSGSIDGVSFVSSDVTLSTYETVSTGRRVSRVRRAFFSGRVFNFEFNKSFTGRVFVMEKGEPKTQYDTEEVELESGEFNDIFNIYATDSHTAFYVLTPQIMEGLLKIERNHPGDLSFSFIGNKLNIAINNNLDTFALTMFRPLDETAIKSFKEDLDIFKDVIRSLNLNREIFKD